MADKVKDYVDVTLPSPATINGVETKSIRMREPTVADQIAASEVKGNDAERELAYLANLCDVAPDDLKGLTLRNYKRLQETFMGFIE